MKPTIRTTNCDVIVKPERDPRCPSCSEHRKTLNSMLFRIRKSEESSNNKGSPTNHTNYKYLNTPDKVERMKRLHHSVRMGRKQYDRLKLRLADAIAHRGVIVDDELQSDLTQIMQDNAAKIKNTYPPNSFAQIFLDHQLKATSLKDDRSMRWEPMMIRWCLYISSPPLNKCI